MTPLAAGHGAGRPDVAGAGTTARHPAGSQWRGWLFVTATLVFLACLLPPLAVLAREHVAIEALRFALLGYAIPPLLVLGLPQQHRARLAGSPIGERAQARRTSEPGPGQRRPVRRPRTVVVLVAFIVVALAWRTPIAVDGVHDLPALVLVEATSLLLAGSALWIELTDSSEATSHLSGPTRMAIAALSMWSIWIVAYLLGFAIVPWYRAFHHVRGGLSVLADQEIACGILWFIPALVFIPVVFTQLTSWLRKEEGEGRPAARRGPITPTLNGGPTA